MSMELVKEFYHLTKTYLSKERYGLVSQTNRAVIPIPGKIAEGMARNYIKDSIQFLHISRGSAHEVETLLSVARMINMISE